MSFKPFIRTDSFTRDSFPKISIRKEHIGFNAVFVKIANLQKFSKVKIEIDEEEFRIGFRFDNEGGHNALALFSDNPSHSTKATGAIKLINRYPFIKKISEFQDPLEREFDVIEYSIIENSTEQSKWESYWLDKFAEKEGRRPFYNKINGKRNN